MKFLIIGCYGLADGYKAMSNGLRYLGYDVAFFPFFAAQDILRGGNHIGYNITNEIVKAVNGDDLTVPLGQYINLCNKKADYIIVWHGVDLCAIYKDIFRDVKTKATPVKLIQLSWDANPHFQEKLDEYYEDYDYIFSVNPVIVEYLTKKGYKNIYHFYPAFDEDFSYYKKSPDHECDVSILLTNLYTHPMWNEKKLCRKKIIDLIYADESINFHLYGPEKFRELYPRAYKGYIPYNDAHLVFSNSTVNLNISPVGDILTRKVGDEEVYYCSERLPQILACSGLMVCDQNFGEMLKDGEDYILLEKEEDIIKVIKNAKKNIKKYNKIRNSGKKKGVELFSNVEFGDCISENIH